MLDNAYISFISETGGGQDGDGNPVSPTLTPSEYVACNLNLLTREYKIVVDGQYVQLKYSVYVSYGKIRSLNINLTTVKSIQIKDNLGRELGVHQVQNLEKLSLTNHVKIVV